MRTMVMAWALVIGMILLVPFPPSVRSQVTDMDGDIAYDVSDPWVEVENKGNGNYGLNVTIDIEVTNTGERTLRVYLVMLESYLQNGSEVLLCPNLFVLGPGDVAISRATARDIPFDRGRRSLLVAYIGLLWVDDGNGSRPEDHTLEDAHYLTIDIGMGFYTKDASDTRSRTHSHIDYSHLTWILLTVQSTMLLALLIVIRSEMTRT